jgi:hypothetical protein
MEQKSGGRCALTGFSGDEKDHTLFTPMGSPQASMPRHGEGHLISGQMEALPAYAASTCSHAPDLKPNTRTCSAGFNGNHTTGAVRFAKEQPQQGCNVTSKVTHSAAHTVTSVHSPVSDVSHIRDGIHRA